MFLRCKIDIIQSYHACIYIAFSLVSWCHIPSSTCYLRSRRSARTNITLPLNLTFLAPPSFSSSSRFLTIETANLVQQACTSFQPQESILCLSLGLHIHQHKETVHLAQIGIASPSSYSVAPCQVSSSLTHDALPIS